MAHCICIRITLKFKRIGKGDIKLSGHKAMTKVYVFDFSNFSNIENDTLYFSFLTQTEKECALQKKNELIKRQYIYSRVLLKYVVSINGFQYGEMIKNKNGKPYFKETPFFNISHSGNIVAVAISDKEVGVDVQKETVVSKQVMDNFFSEEEREYIKKGEITADALWCVKESIFKYYGTGIVSDINMAEILIEKGNIILKNKIGLFIKNICKNGYCISVCAEESGTRDIEFIFLQS